MYARRNKVKLTQQTNDGSTGKAMLALAIILVAGIVAFKTTSGLPRGWR